MKPKKELLRIVKNKEGAINIDTTGKMAGRGAYICKSTECFVKVKKAKRLEKAFECRIDEEIYQNLEKQLEVAND